MAIFFAESMLYFAQYELESSEATPVLGSILMRFGLLEPPQVLLHVLKRGKMKFRIGNRGRGWGKSNSEFGGRDYTNYIISFKIEGGVQLLGIHNAGVVKKRKIRV